VSGAAHGSYYFSVGEPSGDVHAARVVEELRRRGITAITGVGGPHMQGAGARLEHTIDGMSAIGLAEIVTSIPHHARQLSRARKLLRTNGCALTVLVDYPGYNLRLAAAAGRCGVPVLYYIAPQLWAWGRRRIRAMREFVTHVAAILPFEEEFFARQGVPTTFVGHPLLDRPPPPSREAARQQLGLSNSATVLGLFPGSRSGERARLQPTFLDTARCVWDADPTIQIALATQPDFTARTLGEEGIATGLSELVMSASDVVLCKSGTTTLEAAISGKPLCIAYRMHPLTYRIASRVVACRHIGLVNLLLDRRAVPEFVQDSATPENMSRALQTLLDANGRVTQRQRDDLAEVRHLMGTPGAARRVSDLAMELAA